MAEEKELARLEVRVLDDGRQKQRHHVEIEGRGSDLVSGLVTLINEAAKGMGIPRAVFLGRLISLCKGRHDEKTVTLNVGAIKRAMGREERNDG